MADYVYEIMAKIGLDDAEYQRKLVEDGRITKNTSAEIYTAATRIKKAMLMATAAGVAAVGAFAVSSVKTAGEFDTAMSQVAATLGVTVDEVDDLREKALEMGKSTKFTAKEAAEGLNILAMSGYDSAQSIAMIEDVLHLAAAGSMDMASAAGYISGAMKGFNDETKDSQYYADLMAKGATLANTSVSELGEALSDSAAVAASYNQSADSVTLSLLRLAEQGETGSAAGTALAAAMKNLYAPTDQAKKKLEELGVAVYDADGKQRDFNEVVNDLQASMSGLTAEEQTANAQLIFGIQGFNAYNKMVVTSTEKQNEWAAALAGSTGAAEQQYNTMTDNLQGDIDKLKSAFEGFKIEMGEKLMPVIRRVVQSLTGLFDKMDTILPIVAGLATAFGVFAVAINIGSIIKKVTLAFQAFNMVLAANPIGLIIALIAGLVVAIIALWKNNEAFRNKVIEIWTAIKEFVSKAIEAIKKTAEDLKQSWEYLKATVAAFVETVKAKWEELVTAVTTFVENLKTAIAEKWEEIKTTVTEKVQAIVDAVKEKVQAFIDAGKELIQGFLDGITETWNTVVTKVTEFFNGIVDTVKGILGIHSPSKVFQDLGSDTIAGYGEGVESESPSVLEKVSGFAESVIETASGIVKGINEKAGAVGSWIKGLFSWGNEEEGAANETENEAVSASQQTRDAILNSMAGIESDIPGIFEKMAASSKTAMGKLTDAWTEITDLMKQAIEELKTIFEEAMQAMEDRVASTVRNIIVQFKNLEKACREVAAAIRSAFNFNWSMPHIKVPHIVITYTPITDPTVSQMLGGATQMPNFDVIWYRKAYDNPYLFTKPTLLGVGDGAGGEMIYGHESLMNDIREASNNTEIEAKLDQVVELMEHIVRNGLNANLSRNQVYRAINDENRKRSKATNYNSLAMA